MTSPNYADQKAVFGHPTGLFMLFFAEMWERFSYYGMRALLVFYMIKGFLGYGDSQAYTVYGAYTALVYMTPFLGGLLADKLLGRRISVIIGGTFMAAGHLLMTVQSEWPFFFALALLIVGNGFFKPNISTTVGTLYGNDATRRDAGFNIFYMGINLGAAMSPLVCGYVGEKYGWHYGFGLATIGMLVGLAVFVMPTLITQLLIGAAAVATAIGLVVFRPDNAWAVATNWFVAAALLISAGAAVMALKHGGLPKWAGERPADAPRGHDWKVYLGIAIAIPVLAMLVSGFAPFNDGKSVSLISAATIESMASQGAWGAIAAVFLNEVAKPAGLVLTVLGLAAFGYLFRETFRLDRVAKERMLAALVLIFFQMLFFAFFEQAGSSTNNFTDRNVDRVGESKVVTADMVGQTIDLQPTQEQLGYPRDGKAFTLTDLDGLRAQHVEEPSFSVPWTLTQEHVGMGIATRDDELPASIFQAVNPVIILVFALVFNWLWFQLDRRRLNPSAPVKFGLGLFQLGLGFGAYWVGATMYASNRGMVGVSWLVLGYALQTTGELCLSPVGLSVMTRLAPARLVSTLMGGWFLATAFSQYLAAIISQFTGVGEGGGGESVIPAPIETVHVYGGVFGKIAITAMLSGVICWLMTPLLKRWMHEDVDSDVLPFQEKA